ncbi:MAG: hypothetical protein IKC76_06850, partial [Firmicutes bacterium]|nr:hypothetical protein [Bacillota bacterium]
VAGAAGRAQTDGQQQQAEDQQGQHPFPHRRAPFPTQFSSFYSSTSITAYPLKKSNFAPFLPI